MAPSVRDDPGRLTVFSHLPGKKAEFGLRPNRVLEGPLELTTVEQPIEDIAETAVNALRTLIADPDKPLPDYLFRPRLRVRESTAAPRA